MSEGVRHFKAGDPVAYALDPLRNEVRGDRGRVTRGMLGTVGRLIKFFRRPGWKSYDYVVDWTNGETCTVEDFELEPAPVIELLASLGQPLSSGRTDNR